MDKDFLIHNLKIVSQEMIAMRRHSSIIEQAICALLGHIDSDNAFYYGNGIQGSISSIIKEINEMIVELNIKGSIRERANGLIELRTQALGSIYGRTKAEIEQKLTNKLKEVAKEKKARKTALLLSEFYSMDYLPHKIKQNRAENTIKAIESNFRYIVSQGFDKPLTAYKSKEIEDFLYRVKETRKRQVLQGLMNNMFDRALTLALIKSNPCAPIEKMQHTQEQGTALSFDEQLEFFSKLFSSSLSHVEKCYFIFVYLTGTRREEAIKLSVRDVDWDNKVLAIHGEKTEGSDRKIPLIGRVAKLLSTISATNDKFFNLSYDNIGKKFRKIMSTHKIHDLRHTFGTIQICVERIDPKTVSLWLGHTTIDTTLKIYSQYFHTLTTCRYG